MVQVGIAVSQFFNAQAVRTDREGVLRIGLWSNPEGTVVATVVRDGRPTVPTPDMELRPGDELLVVSHTATEEEIRAAAQ
ncbi:TrkA C-terminal domain-containing protein [Streptomyces sp. NPDC088732]|uniref:TrkA C-terminal domain-containing protein n=1 Tax=Streptomyces sp. NPDC088732 TaxID=3365879 RepID=UPI0037FD8C4C